MSATEATSGPAKGHDRVITIIEALALATVAVLAAWSGYSAARWSTASHLDLARASTTRSEANRAYLDAGETRDLDSTMFNAWFTSYLKGNQEGMALAEKRFRPEFKLAFDAWLDTDPATNPSAPAGPTYMPQYPQPDLARSADLDAMADGFYAKGAAAGGHADDYIRITVYLAAVLLLVGVSGHFRLKAARIGLVVLGGAILVYGAVLLIAAPKPPA